MFVSKEASLELNIGICIVKNRCELWGVVLTLMTGVASIEWLHTRGIGVVNRIASLSISSRGMILILHWVKDELEQLKGVSQSCLNYYK